MEKAINNLGLEFRRSKVGDRFISEMLRETGWKIGGESSGHILCLEYHSTGDGIINSLQVIKTLLNSDSSFNEWTKELQLMPQHLMNVSIRDFPNWEENRNFMNLRRKINKDLDGNGRVLVRPSGTEPLLRIMVESDSLKKSKMYAEELAFVLNE